MAVKKAVKNVVKSAKKKTTKKTEAKVVQAEIIDSSNHSEVDDLLPPDEIAKLTPTDDQDFHDDDIIIPTKLPATVKDAAHSRGVSTTDPLTMYLQEIRKYPVLSKDEEQVVAKKYFETKDSESAQKLIQSNLRFVVKIAAEYSKFGSKMIDLIQEGNVGLMHAVKEYNPYKGARLITYAVWWIRGYIQEYLMRQYSMVRIGTTQNQRKLFYQLQKNKKILDSMSSEEDLHALSERLGIPEDEVQSMAQRIFQRDVSFDKPVNEDSGTSIGDLQKNTNDEALDDTLVRLEQLEILKEKIDEIRDGLSEREKILLEERLLSDQPLTLQEIGDKYKITREAVRQLEARLIKKIQQKMLGSGDES